MNKRGGFTLIEILVALSIFGILVTVSMSAFARGFKLQKRALEMQDLQKDSFLILEMTGRELRMSREIDLPNPTTIDFINSNNQDATFCRGIVNSSAEAVCNAEGDKLVFRFYEAGKWQTSVLNSSTVQLKDLRFINMGNSYVSIFLKLKTPTGETSFQTGVVVRSEEI